MPLTDVFGQVNVIGGTVATLIAPAAGNRYVMQLYNAGAATVYIGGATVTTANGWPLAAAGQPLPIFGPSAIYGIVASGTIDVRYIYSA